jgi:hypothetical protein
MAVTDVAKWAILICVRCDGVYDRNVMVLVDTEGRRGFILSYQGL